MTAQDFARAITPFRPFRLLTTSGQTYDIRHREAFVFTPTYITVGLLEGPAPGMYERTVIVDLFHVESVEPLPSPVPKGNGQGGE